MLVRKGGRSAVVVALLVAILATTFGEGAAMARSHPTSLQAFLYAIGKVESGGRYTARNARTGAYGKYQIMPSNWPAWARRYLGNAHARQTPRNQEIVAARKMTSLKVWLGSWRRVAFWWLTGSSQRTGWSASATRYVGKVMRHYVLAARGRVTIPGIPSGGRPSPSSSVRHVPEGSSSITYAGAWRSARYSGYVGSRVRYATRAGASATVTFVGRRITWYGPTGPTRGKAQVYVDGRLARTIDLRSSSFRAHTAIFGRSWSTSGRHVVRIVVVGTRARPMVAIDEFVVRR